MTDTTLSPEQLQALALGEQRAPAEVDTLRDDACPVCGSTDYRGSTCSSCGYAKSPVIFHDPNVEKAQQTELRTPTAPVDLACDSCGAEYPAHPTKEALRRQADTIPAPPGLGGREDEEEVEPEEPQDDPLEPEPEAPTSTGPAAPANDHERGDVCPSCGQGTLLPKDEVDGVEAEEVEAFDSEGDPVEDAEEAVEGDPEVPEQETEDDPDEETEDEEDSQEDDESDLSEDEDDPEERVKSPGAKSRTSQKEQSMTDQPNPAAQERRALREALSEQGERLAAQARLIRRQAASNALLSQETRTLRQAVLALAAQSGNKAVVASLDPRRANAAEEKDPVALTDETAVAPEATTDLESTETVATDAVTPEATTDVETEAVALDTKPLNDLQDVTEEHNDVGDATGTTTDHTGPAKNAPANNPIEESGWKTSSASGERTWASMRLAKLRVNAGLEQGDPTVLAQKIASDESVSMESIETEVRTLVALAKRTQADAPTEEQRRHLVPRSASRAPSLAGGGTATASADQGGDFEGVNLDDTLM